MESPCASFQCSILLGIYVLGLLPRTFPLSIIWNTHFMCVCDENIQDSFSYFDSYNSVNHDDSTMQEMLDLFHPSHPSLWLYLCPLYPPPFALPLPSSNSGNLWAPLDFFGLLVTSVVGWWVDRCCNLDLSFGVLPRFRCWRVGSQGVVKTLGARFSWRSLGHWGCDLTEWFSALPGSRPCHVSFLCTDYPSSSDGDA